MYCVFIWSRGIMFVHCQLLHPWHVKVVDSFQDQLKMGTRLADFACTIGWILSWIYSCLIGTLSTQKILHQGHGGRWQGWTFVPLVTHCQSRTAMGSYTVQISPPTMTMLYIDPLCTQSSNKAWILPPIVDIVSVHPIVHEYSQSSTPFWDKYATTNEFHLTFNF